MSILIHGFDPALDRVAPTPRLPKERKAQCRRTATQASALLSMGSVLTALIGLKIAIQIWLLHV